jgi:copper chaperone CopZ
MEVTVKDMNCSHCKQTILSALEDAGYKSVKINLKKKTIKIKSDDIESVKKIITEKGYTVE